MRCLTVRLAGLLGVALSMALPRGASSAVCRTGWCDCDDPYRRHGSLRASVKVLRDSASAVVAGTIVRVGPAPGDIPSDTTVRNSPVIAWVQVTHRWKGVTPDTVRVSLHSTREAAPLCRYAVAPGEQHLFFLQQDGSDGFHAGRCSGSLRLDAPPDETLAGVRATADSFVAALGHDFAVADTIAPPYRGPHDPKMFALVYGGWIVLLAAPAAFAFLPMEDSGKTKRHANYLSASAGVGYGEHERRGWSHVQSVEALWNGLYAEVRAESYHVPSYSGVQAARAGYLWRRRRTVAGGITAGYVRGAGDNLPGGLEVGLPLLLQLERGWMRFDATYILTSEVGYYNWRTVMALALPRKPFVGGFSYDIRTPIRGEEPFSAPVLFIGTRF